MDERRNGLLAMLARLHAESVRSARKPSEDVARGVAGQAGVPGFVSLVGAGPGDPELLTRRAAHRLAEADLVLYDALVDPATVSLAVRAQRILVGRRRGSATAGQDAINRTMIRAARRGRRVVRLKGGDPLVFGRGGEEAVALAGAGVAFEIVPGVSSAFAAPALASIPVTHRGLSSAVFVTTGHDVERLVSLVGSVAPGSLTLVVLMGTGNRAAIMDALIDAGWSRTTPAAIVWDASLPDARVWAGPLDELSTADVPGDRPGTIVVGTVVALRRILTTDEATDRREVCHG
jgi:uroporphyrin-III C-methyltransferase/precorrin-2 dehydrogenase/sirohydrochlorin ferrochelatase